MLTSNNNKYRLTLSELLFFLGIACFGFEKNVYEGSYFRFLLPDFMEQVLKYSTLLLFMSAIVVKKRRRKYFFREIALFLIVTSISVIVGNTTLILLGMAIFASMNIEFDKIVSVCLKVNIICIMIVVFSCIAGAIPNIKFEHDGEIAWSMGYFYYSNFAYQSFFALISALYLRKRKMKDILGYLIASFMIYKITTVRLTFYFSLIFIVMLVVSHKLTNKIWCRMGTVMFPCAAVGSIVIAYLYGTNNAIINKMNFILLNRIKFSYWALINNGITMFGNHIETSEALTSGTTKDWSTYFYVDSGYIYTLVEYGIIVFLFIVIAYSLIARYVLESKKQYLAVWAMTVCLLSLINNMLTNITVNPLIFLLPAEIKKIRLNRKHSIKRHKYAVPKWRNIDV